MKRLILSCLCILMLITVGCDSNNSDSSASSDYPYVMNTSGLLFDNTRKINIPDADDLHLGDGSYTIHAWVKVGELTDYFQDILVKSTTSPNTDYDAGLDRDNHFQFWANQDGIHLKDMSTEVLPGHYYHYAVVYDKADGTAKLYINGEMKVSDVIAGTPLKVSNRLLIGGHNTEGLPKPQNWNGIIYNVTIWEVAKTGAQVKDLMYKKLNGDEEGLVACWYIDEGSGTTVKDITGKHNGTIIGSSPQWVSMPY
jgi:uncharacterized protein